jgi:hypothetical protein
MTRKVSGYYRAAEKFHDEEAEADVMLRLAMQA